MLGKGKKRTSEVPAVSTEALRKPVFDYYSCHCGCDMPRSRTIPHRETMDRCVGIYTDAFFYEAIRLSSVANSWSGSTGFDRCAFNPACMLR